MSNDDRYTIRRPEPGRPTDRRVDQRFLDVRPELSGLAPFVENSDVDLLDEVERVIGNVRADVAYSDPALGANLRNVLDVQVPTKLAEVDAVVETVNAEWADIKADTAQQRAALEADLGLISVQNVAALTGKPAGGYRVLDGDRRVWWDGENITAEAPAAAPARTSRPGLNPRVFGLSDRGDASSPLQTLINEAATTRTARRTVIDLDGLDVDHTSTVTIPATLGRVVLSGGTLRQGAGGLLDVAAGLDRLVIEGMAFDGLGISRNNGAVYNRARVTEFISSTVANYPRATQGVIKMVAAAAPEVLRVADTELTDCHTGLVAGTDLGLRKASFERNRLLNTFGTGVVSGTTATTITLSDVNKTADPWRLMAPWIREWRVGEYIRVSRMAAGTVGGFYLITAVSRSGSSVILTVATDPSAAVAAGDEAVSMASTSMDLSVSDFVQLNETRSGSYPCQVSFRDNFTVGTRMAEEIQNRSADVQSSGNTYLLAMRYGISHPDGYRSRVDRDTIICPVVADGGAYGIEHTVQRDGRITDSHIEGGYTAGILALAYGDTGHTDGGGITGNTFAITRGGATTSDIQFENGIKSGFGSGRTALARNYRITGNLSRSYGSGHAFARSVSVLPLHVEITGNQIVPGGPGGVLLRAPGQHWVVRGNRAIYDNGFAGERDALIVQVGQATAATTLTVEDNVVQMPTDRPYYLYRSTNGRTTISTTSSEQALITRRNTVLAGDLRLHDGSTAYAQEYNSGTNTGSTIRWITERNLGLTDSNVARTVTAGSVLPVRSEMHALTAASAVTTADPALPDGREIGQRVTYINAGANIITVKQGVKVQVGGADLPLAANQSLTLTWSGAAWVR